MREGSKLSLESLTARHPSAASLHSALAAARLARAAQQKEKEALFSLDKYLTPQANEGAQTTTLLQSMPPPASNRLERRRASDDAASHTIEALLDDPTFLSSFVAASRDSSGFLTERITRKERDETLNQARAAASAATAVLHAAAPTARRYTTPRVDTRSAPLSGSQSARSGLADPSFARGGLTVFLKPTQAEVEAAAIRQAAQAAHRPAHVPVRPLVPLTGASSQRTLKTAQSAAQIRRRRVTQPAGHLASSHPLLPALTAPMPAFNNTSVQLQLFRLKTAAKANSRRARRSAVPTPLDATDAGTTTKSALTPSNHLGMAAFDDMNEHIKSLQLHRHQTHTVPPDEREGEDAGGMAGKRSDKFRRILQSDATHFADALRAEYAGKNGSAQAGSSAHANFKVLPTGKTILLHSAAPRAESPADPARTVRHVSISSTIGSQPDSPVVGRARARMLGLHHGESDAKSGVMSPSSEQRALLQASPRSLSALTRTSNSSAGTPPPFEPPMTSTQESYYDLATKQLSQLDAEDAMMVHRSDSVNSNGSLTSPSPREQDQLNTVYALVSKVRTRGSLRHTDVPSRRDSGRRSSRRSSSSGSSRASSSGDEADVDIARSQRRSQDGESHYEEKSAGASGQVSGQPSSRSSLTTADALAVHPIDSASIAAAASTAASNSHSRSSSSLKGASLVGKSSAKGAAEPSRPSQMRASRPDYPLAEEQLASASTSSLTKGVLSASPSSSSTLRTGTSDTDSVRTLPHVDVRAAPRPGVGPDGSLLVLPIPNHTTGFATFAAAHAKRTNPHVKPDARESWSDAIKSRGGFLSRDDNRLLRDFHISAAKPWVAEHNHSARVESHARDLAWQMAETLEDSMQSALTHRAAVTVGSQEAARSMQAAVDKFETEFETSRVETARQIAASHAAHHAHFAQLEAEHVASAKAAAAAEAQEQREKRLAAEQDFDAEERALLAADAAERRAFEQAQLDALRARQDAESARRADAAEQERIRRDRLRQLELEADAERLAELARREELARIAAWNAKRQTARRGILTMRVIRCDGLPAMGATPRDEFRFGFQLRFNAANLPSSQPIYTPFFQTDRRDQGAIFNHELKFEVSNAALQKMSVIVERIPTSEIDNKKNREIAANNHHLTMASSSGKIITPLHDARASGASTTLITTKEDEASDPSRRTSAPPQNLGIPAQYPRTRYAGHVIIPVLSVRSSEGGILHRQFVLDACRTHPRGFIEIEFRLRPIFAQTKGGGGQQVLESMENIEAELDKQWDPYEQMWLHTWKVEEADSDDEAAAAARATPGMTYPDGTASDSDGELVPAQYSDNSSSNSPDSGSPVHAARVLSQPRDFARQVVAASADQTQPDRLKPRRSHPHTRTHSFERSGADAAADGDDDADDAGDAEAGAITRASSSLTLSTRSSRTGSPRTRSPRARHLAANAATYTPSSRALLSSSGDWRDAFASQPGADDTGGHELHAEVRMGGPVEADGDPDPHGGADGVPPPHIEAFIRAFMEGTE